MLYALQRNNSPLQLLHHLCMLHLQLHKQYVSRIYAQLCLPRESLVPVV
jgi:hypothetical protein